MSYPTFKFTRKTAVSVTRLDDVEPGLRLVEKFHPSGGPYADPSYSQEFGLRGSSLSRLDKTLVPKTPLK